MVTLNSFKMILFYGSAPEQRSLSPKVLKAIFH